MIHCYTKYNFPFKERLFENNEEELLTESYLTFSL
jgi:hypothetical protein